jgi:hypothetical protein
MQQKYLDIADKIIDLYGTGLGYRVISKQFGISDITVKKILNFKRIKTRLSGSTKFTGKYSELQVDSIINDYLNSDLTQSEVALKYNLSQTAISYYLKIKGIKAKSSISNNKSIIEKVLYMYSFFMDQQDIAKELGIDHNTIHDILLKYNINLRPKGGYRGYRRYTINENYFSNIDSYDKAYILGIIFTDGHLDLDNKYTLSIGLASKDKPLLELIKSSMGSDALIYDQIDYRYESPRYKSLLRISSKQLLTDLQKYGLIQNKTFTIEFPKMIDKHYMPNFILGVMDGDGGWWGSIDSPTWGMVSASEAFITDIKYYLESCLPLANNTIRKEIQYKDGNPRKHPLFSLRYSGWTNCQLLYDFLYQDATIWLQRKRNRIASILSGRMIKKIGRPKNVVNSGLELV